MLAGIVFQLGKQYPVKERELLRKNIIVALVVFSTLLTEYFIRFFQNRPLRARATATLLRKRPWDGRLKLAAFGLTFSTICLFIRYATLCSYPHSGPPPDAWVWVAEVSTEP
jgi:hypothetical protein